MDTRYAICVLFRSATGGQFSMTFHGSTPAIAKANAEHFIKTSSLKPVLIGEPS